jgi:hypothetical protein
MLCKDCDLTDYCFSDPVTWEFHSPAHHWEVVSKMGQCLREIASRLGKEDSLIDIKTLSPELH